MSGGDGGGEEGVGQKSSQHLFSQSFVRASLNMDGVWSRAGASGTPQTAQAAQAGPSCCVRGLLSFSPRLSLCLPPLLPRLTPVSSLSSPLFISFFSQPVSLISSINHSDDEVCVFSLLGLSTLVFSLYPFSLLSLFILFLLYASTSHPCSFPSLCSIFSPTL